MNVCEFPTSAPATIPHHTMTTDIVGRFVIVKYDAQPFVGQVLNLVGDELEVSCMRQTMGRNAFVWPTAPDVIFYYVSDMQAILSEPEPLTNRSSQLCIPDWDTFQNMW